jgi:hypothetical protein
MLAHVHVMKTAGQTISGILRQSFPGNHCDLHTPSLVATAADLRLARRVYPKLQSISGHGVRPYSDLAAAGQSLRYFTFLRDPIERCASHYQFSVARDHLPGGLTAFLHSWGGNHQTSYFSPTANAEEAIEAIESQVGFVGLLERFGESLAMWQQWAGEPRLNVNVRSRNVAADNRVKSELLADPESLALMHECNQHDLRLYRYVCDVIYPRQLRQYQARCQPVDRAPTRGVRWLPPESLLARAKRNLLYKPLARSFSRAA